jgi:hypothetical protein
MHVLLTASIMLDQLLICSCFDEPPMSEISKPLI